MSDGDKLTVPGMEEVEKSTTTSSTKTTTIVLPAETIPTPTPRPMTESRRRMQEELDRMKQAEENAHARRKAKRKEEVQKAIAAMYEEKKKVGLTITPDVEASRVSVRAMMRNDERSAMEKEQRQLKRNTERLLAEIDSKYGLSERKQGPDLVKLADQYYHGTAPDRDGLTDEVRRELTQDEIRDLRMVYDMFDVKGRGYITANDVKRAASMLGFKAKKDIFKDMIAEVTGGKTSRISFLNFLQFVVKGQGQGPDPVEDIMRGFRLLDSDQKGFVTAADLRQAADTQKLSFSNRAIREMIQEADLTGDGKISADEFVHIMLQCSMFKSYR